MTPIPGLRRLFRLAAGRSTTTDDVAEEIELHVTLRAEELVAEGLSPEQARAEALRCFGDLAAIKQTVTAIDREKERAMRRSNGSIVLGDFRHALAAARSQVLAPEPAALGLGSFNTAIFSSSTRAPPPLQFVEPDQLGRVEPQGGSVCASSRCQWRIRGLEASNLVQRMPLRRQPT